MFASRASAVHPYLIYHNGLETDAAWPYRVAAHVLLCSSSSSTLAAAPVPALPVQQAQVVSCGIFVSMFVE